MWCSEHEISYETRCPLCYHDLDPEERDIGVTIEDVRWQIKAEELIALVSYFDAEVYIVEHPRDVFPIGMSATDARFPVIEIDGELYKNIQEISDKYDVRKVFTQSEG